MNNPHKNARTCVYSREQIVQRYERGETVGDIALAFGISVRTVYKWLGRHRQDGSAGLENRSSRPRSNPHAYLAGWYELIAKLRRHRMTALEIAGALGFPRSSVAHALKSIGLTRLNRLTPPEPVRRYERKRPGELLHLDIKKLGRFNKIGHRITGHHRRQRSRGLGYDYVHVAIDDHSRAAYVEVLEDETAFSCAMFLVRAAKWFASKGVVIERVMTDNGVGYKARKFAATVRQLGARHLRTKPYTPKTNGKAERFIKTLQEEWAYAMPYQSSQRRNANLQRWLKIYNCERPHAGINMKPPISRLSQQA
jgi:transposase InsO family protein